jgi:peroxiredoxin
MTSSRSTDGTDDATARVVRWLALVLGLAALLLVAALAALPWLASQPRPAPEVTFQIIAGDRAGQRKALHEMRGDVVLVSFWSTTCAPCMAEMQDKMALHRQMAPRGLKTYAVAMQQDRPDMVMAMAQRLGMPFEIALDLQGDVAKAFNNTDVTPTKFLVDRQGRIVKRYVGFTDFPALKAEIEAALTAPRA